jgi:uncharacterized membrane protein
MRTLFRYFLQGLLYSVPLAIVVFVIYKLFIYIGTLVKESGLTFHPLIDPFLAIIAFVATVIAIGVLGNSILFRPLFIAVETVLEKAPLINIFYTSIKDLLSALLGTGKKYKQPVLVKMNSDHSIEKIGFITREDLKELGIEGGKVAVYFPHSFNFSGNLFVVSKSNITPIYAPTSEIMKFVVSGGVAGVLKDEQENHLN